MRTYVCIDLKSFYASVECVQRGLDPLTTNLVVADPSRTEKTICLAITPAMKALGIRNRCRVFEIPDNVEYIMARPRMRRYMEVSADIYAIYLRYVSAEDIHVYSIDECFIDATPYLVLYEVDARGFAQMLMDAVVEQTGISATAGIGDNLFLAKVALDITAKHAPDRIGHLDQEEFQRTIAHHRPITDIWNIGPGIAGRLARFHVFDLAGVCEMDEDVLYSEFGVNAEYLIDHAHGVEPCTIAQIHAYEPRAHSLGNGQVLACDYTVEEARMVLQEMVDQLVLDAVDKHLVAQSISLSMGYAKPAGTKWHEGSYQGEHGRRVARAELGGRTGGTRKLGVSTSSLSAIMPRFMELFDATVDADRPVRRLNIALGGLVDEDFATVDLFTDVEALQQERQLQETVLAVKGKFGKNALLKGRSLRDKATARERNNQVGGHHA